MKLRAVIFHLNWIYSCLQTTEVSTANCYTENYYMNKNNLLTEVLMISKLLEIVKNKMYIYIRQNP